MFSKIWHGILIVGIIVYSGNIYFAETPCERVNRSGSVVRVLASGLFLLSDNWMTPADQLGMRKQAHKFDLWAQNIIKVTFFGRELVCMDSAKDDSVLKQNQKTSNEKGSTDPTSKRKKSDEKQKITKAEIETPEVQEVVNLNPYNLPSLPETEAKR